MRYQQIFSLKLTVAVAMSLFIGTSPVHAVATGGTQQYWYNLEGDTTTPYSAAMQVLDVTKLTANSDGSVNFKLEWMMSHNVERGLDSQNVEIHYNNDKIDPIAATNIRTAGTSQPAGADFEGTDYASFEADFGSAALDDGDANTGHLVYGGWQHADNSFVVFDVPNRLATIEFQWRAGAVGDSSLNFITNATVSPLNSPNFVAVNLTIRGPEVPQVAKLSVDPTRVDQGTSAATATLTCTLIGADGNVLATGPTSATNCVIPEPTVTVLGTSTAAVGGGTNYTIDPTGAQTITIAASATSGTQAYMITPADGDEMLAFKFVVTEITGGVIAAAGADSIDSTKTSALFRVVTAGLAITMASPDGTCPETNLGSATTLTVPEGEARSVCLSALSDPGNDGPVSLVCVSDDVPVVAVSGSGSLTTGTSRVAFILTAPDNNTAAADGSAVITCTGTGSGGPYASVTEMIAVTVTEDDSVSTEGTLSATSTISEKGGEQPIVVTASIKGPAVPASDCTVAVALAGTAPSGLAPDILAAAPADYVTFTPEGITITAGNLSGTSMPNMVTPVEDDDKLKEGIAFTATGSCSGTGSTATIFNADNAFTLIVDKGGMETAQNVSYAVVPVITQLSLASTMLNIESRADAPRNTGANFSLAGNTSAEGTLLDHMKRASSLNDVRDYEYDWKRALADSSFAMPVSGFGGATLWASGDYRTLNGNDGVTDWEGNAFLLNFGADTRLNNDMLVGAMVSMSESSIDYKENSLGTNSEGEYSLDSLAFRPYFSWSTGSTDIWGSLGFGTGELELKADEEETARTSDTSETSLALGIEQGLVEGLSIKADVSMNTTDIDAKKEGDTDIIGAQEVESQRVRLLLAGKNAYNSANGTITPNVEIGIRHDTTETDKATRLGSDTFEAQENTSTGAEAAMGVDFANAATGLTLSVKARFYSGNDYDEWGISGVVEKKTDSGGLGLSLSMRPTYGDTQSNVSNIWDQSFEDSMKESNKTTTEEKIYSASMNSAFGYGFAAPGGRGVLTPYAKAVLGGDVANSHTFGLRWKPHSRFNIDVHGEDKSTANDYRMVLRWVNKRLLDFTLTGARSEGASIDHSLVLKGTLDF